jgi:hypothetical protein
MIADSNGEMPPGLRNDADWRLFQAALDCAAMVVLGRLGHERNRNPGRRRLALTRQTSDLEPDPRDPEATFWNPAGLPIELALERLGVKEGVLAVTGGTAAFDLFLPHFDRFVLSEVTGLAIPGGAPCFSGGSPRKMLACAGLIADVPQVVDRAAHVSMTAWRRVSAD